MSKTFKNLDFYKIKKAINNRKNLKNSRMAPKLLYYEKKPRPKICQ